MPKCQSCGKRIEAKARICAGCGALTGVSMPCNDEPVSFGWLAFLAAFAISATYLLFMDWMAP